MRNLVSGFSTPLLFAGFAGASLIVLVCGIRITSVTDRLADRTGIGEALMGGIFLGAATSLSGAVVSLTTALDGYPSLAFSNCVGGIAAQTAFLSIADIVYRRANLEHAAADLTNVFQAALLMLLLCIPIVAFATPEVSFVGIHPASFVLMAVYVFGVKASYQIRERPMWQPVTTHVTDPDTPDEDSDNGHKTAVLLCIFAGLMLAMGGAGWVIAQTAVEITNRFGLSATTVGVLLTAIATSLPELVTTLAAVRSGALQLAVGGIIGGNTIDTMFITISDIGYRDGSIYHALGSGDFFWLAVGLVMTAVLTLGLLFRERRGPATIGWEGLAMLCIYVSAVAVQVLTG